MVKYSFFVLDHIHPHHFKLTKTESDSFYLVCVLLKNSKKTPRIFMVQISGQYQTSAHLQKSQKAHLKKIPRLNLLPLGLKQTEKRNLSVASTTDPMTHTISGKCRS